MSNKTINQALEGLYKGLGGDPSALADNSTCSDYIADLESAIKGAASGAAEDLIDDSAASTATTYSSTMIESLIPTDELPEVTAADIGDVLQVVSDGEEGATWGKGEIVIPSELPSVAAEDIGEVLQVVSDGEGGAEWGKGAMPTPEQNTEIFEVKLSGDTTAIQNGKTVGDIRNALNNGKVVFLKDTSVSGREKIYKYAFTDYAESTNNRIAQFCCVYVSNESTNLVIKFEMIGYTTNTIDSSANFYEHIKKSITFS